MMDDRTSNTSRDWLGRDVDYYWSHSSSLVSFSDAGPHLTSTWLDSAIQPEATPLRAARWTDVEQLLDAHVERLDTVYRRLA